MGLTDTDRQIFVSPEQLKEVSSLYHSGLYLQAYRAAEKLGPLNQWRGTSARLLAGRLAQNLGAPRLGSAIHYFAYRSDRSNHEALYYYTRLISSAVHPLRFWRFIKQQRNEIESAPAEIKADWLAFVANMYGLYRDFEEADKLSQEAQALAPERSWIFVESAYLLQAEDEYQEALKAASHALELRPWYRPAIQCKAHLLELLGRDEEALALLSEACSRIEYGGVYSQLGRLQQELVKFQSACESFKKARELYPIAEKSDDELSHAHISDAFYLAGDLQRSLEHAEKATTFTFYVDIARKLKETIHQPVIGTQAQTLKRALLPLSFVRQHNVTCAPATLTTISRYWSKSVDHLEIAEEICYDGTPAHSERNWAAKNGFIAVEFTITWENTVQLIDRGIPFTFTTVDATNGHLQAVIGYDAFRGTLIVRDPYVRHFREFIADNTFERYKSSGPRGMAMVPVEKKELLDGLELLDSKVYDFLHSVNTALDKHDRPSAWQAFLKLSESSPSHRLTLQARRSIAMYDGDQATLLECAEAMLKQFPREPRLILNKLSCLRQFARTAERVQILDEICSAFARPPKDSDRELPLFDPVFWLSYAQELASDARQQQRCIELLMKSIRYRPLDPFSYWALANTHWNSRRFDDAIDLYRTATCLNDRDDQFARSYFTASRLQNRHGPALQLIENAFKREAKRSATPAQKLFWALEQLHQQTAGFAGLESALKLRPNDGALILYAAEMYASYNKIDRATELLNEAKGKCRHASWLRTCAIIARNRSELKEAQQYWRQVVDMEPLNLEAQRAYVLLLAETEGVASAINYLSEQANRFPFSLPINALQAEWLRNEDPIKQEAVLRHMLELDPADSWVLRELVGSLTRQRRLDEARKCGLQVLELDPTSPSSSYALSRVELACNDIKAARDYLKKAISLSADATYAIHDLLDTCQTQEERLAALDYVLKELVKQVIAGDGLLTYRDRAANTLEPEAVLKSLRDALAARPDLWHAWSCVIQQHTRMDKLEEAFQLATTATERFPLCARLWLDLSEIEGARANRDGQIAALKKTLEVDPHWAYAARELAIAYERVGELKRARTVLETAVANSPLDSYNFGCLAFHLWKNGDKAEALKQLKHALRLNSQYSWAWQSLSDWSNTLSLPDEAVELAKELTQKRPGDAASWIRLAEMLPTTNYDERLQCLDKAIQLNAYADAAHDMRAVILAEQRKYDHALKACRPEIFEKNVPLLLRGRAAWVEAQKGDLKKASADMREVLKDDPNYYWGWMRIAEWAQYLDDIGSYTEAAQNIARIAPNDAYSVAQLGRAKMLAKDYEGAKALLKHALEMEPDCASAGRNLFDLHFDAKQYDEAGNVIENLRRHNGDDPYTLARVAQLMGVRKNIDGLKSVVKDLSQSNSQNEWPITTAAEVLKSVLGPDDALKFLEELSRKQTLTFWSYKCIAELARQQKHKQALIESAKQMVNLRPNDAYAHGMLGIAKTEINEEADAIAAFRHAFELDCTYSFAGCKLFDLLLKSKKLDEADSTIKKLLTNCPDAFSWFREVEYACKTQNRDRSHAALRELVKFNTSLVDTALDFFNKARGDNLLEDALRVVKDSLIKDETHPETAAVWVRRMIAERKFDAIESVLRELQSARAAAWEHGASEYVEGVAKAKLTNRLNKYIDQNSAALRKHSMTWGSVGHAYVGVNNYLAVTKWMADREKHEVKPWMLLNLLIALHTFGKLDQARSVADEALKLPADNTTCLHRVWVAWHNAVEGRFAAARDLMNDINHQDVTDYYKTLLRFTEAMLEADSSSDSAFRIAKSTLANAVARAPWMWSDGLMKKAYLSSARRIAARCPGLRSTIWLWLCILDADLKLV